MNDSSVEISDHVCTPRRKIRGVIVRRRSLGAKLAFADIKCNDDDDDDDSTVTSVAFRAANFVPTCESLFPNKKSMLPYGATVQVLLEPSPDERGPRWQVVTWKILDNPSEQAQSMSRQEGGGVVYSKYLKMRGNAYLDLQSSKPVDRPPRAKCGQDHQFDHGRNKALRAKIFSKWLVETMGIGNEDTVLDIAGGKGLLSMELARIARIPCTVVDPLIRKRPKMKQLERLEAPLPEFRAEPFYNDENTVKSLMVESSTLLVGLHPDECTEDILDVALKCGKSVAIVPCCVYPSLFPSRRLKDGREVTLYGDFLEYLLEKDGRIRQAELPIDGKNQVIYLKV